MNNSKQLELAIAAALANNPIYGVRGIDIDDFNSNGDYQVAVRLDMHSQAGGGINWKPEYGFSRALTKNLLRGCIGKAKALLNHIEGVGVYSYDGPRMQYERYRSNGIWRESFPRGYDASIIMFHLYYRP